ncbi:MAG: hypothetical protein R2857_05045 [Vampirovibrionales bacterium]
MYFSSALRAVLAFSSTSAPHINVAIGAEDVDTTGTGVGHVGLFCLDVILIGTVIVDAVLIAVVVTLVPSVRREATNLVLPFIFTDLALMLMLLAVFIL